MYEKRKITKQIGCAHILKNVTRDSLNAFQSLIEDFKLKGTTHIVFRDNDLSTAIEPYTQSIETDEQYKLRMEEIERMEAIQASYREREERKTYEMLKLKFEK